MELDQHLHHLHDIQEVLEFTIISAYRFLHLKKQIMDTRTKPLVRNSRINQQSSLAAKIPFNQKQTWLFLPRPQQSAYLDTSMHPCHEEPTFLLALSLLS